MMSSCGRCASPGACGKLSCASTAEHSDAREIPPELTAEVLSKWIIIGISGATCSGKTTLTNKLRLALTPVYIFNQDHYFHADDSKRHVLVEGLDVPHNNYDVLSSLDMDRMFSDIVSTLCGADRATSRGGAAVSGQLASRGKQFALIEGFTALNYTPIRDICHLKYYLELRYEECLERRSLRLYSPPDVPGYFDKCVWPQHLHYKAEILKDTSIVRLDGTKPGNFDVIIEDVRRLGCSVITDVYT